MNKSRTRSIVLSGLSIALLAVAANISVPIGLVPFTMQTMVLMLIVLLLTPGESLATVGGYLALGAFGMPVGAGFKGGLAWIIGPTGGFLIGFFLATAVIAAIRLLIFTRIANDFKPRFIAAAATSGICLLLIYNVFGITWFCIVTGAELPAAIAACTLPFIVPDCIKLILAAACVKPVAAALKRGIWQDIRKNQPKPA
jgi:biotin transport system substrate-specific component